VQWFEVPIEGEGLVQAEQALNRVQIPTLGPGYTVRGDRKSPEGARVPRHMLAVLEAESAEDAETERLRLVQLRLLGQLRTSRHREGSIFSL
jgi:hypothetical protein